MLTIKNDDRSIVGLGFINYCDDLEPKDIPNLI